MLCSAILLSARATLLSGEEERKLLSRVSDKLVMPSPAKDFIHGQTYFITFRTEEGLPFVAIPLINEILWSCLAKSQRLYPQKIHGMCFQANHQHLLLGCQDPEQMPAFIGYIKQESAHAINRLLGRRRKTVWAEGYDSPIILDYQKFLFCLAYVKLNPLKDLIVPNMESFKGISTWDAFKKDRNSRKARVISRDSITKLRNPHQPWIESDKVLKELFEKNKMSLELKFDFYSWKECFPETRVLSDLEVRRMMLESLGKYEASLLDRPEMKKKYHDHSKQSMLKSYVPKKYGKKMICLSDFKELRIDYINYYKDKIAEAKHAYKQWKKGDFRIPYPLGLFAPPLPRTANLVPSFVPI